MLEPYSKSVRARQKMSPKFYFFDCGVVRTISLEINEELTARTFSYGNLFEQLVICEIIRLNQYLERNYKFSYLRTGAGVEIDLIIEKSKHEIVLIEIKSTSTTSSVISKHLTALNHFKESFPGASKYLLCLDKNTRMTEDILIIEWREGIKRIFNV